MISSGQFSSASASPSYSATRYTGNGGPADFQPPYFPYPQQHLDFNSHVNGVDAYAHLNNFPPQQWQHVVGNTRRDAQEALHTFQTANGQHLSFQPAYDARRGEYPQIRRPDILVHAGVGAHAGMPSEQDLMQLSSASMLQQVMDVDGQVNRQTQAGNCVGETSSRFRNFWIVESRKQTLKINEVSGNYICHESGKQTRYVSETLHDK